MDEAKGNLVKNWLLKAKHDIASAKKLSSGEDSYLDTAIYHCQQGVEKALKGFLVFHDLRFKKSHDLEILISLAKSVEPDFDSFVAMGEELTPYATLYRYPGEVIEPELSEFEDALKSAEKICDFVYSLLPEEVQP